MGAPISREKVDQIFQLRSQGLSKEAIAKQLGIGYGTVVGYLQQGGDPFKTPEGTTSPEGTQGKATTSAKRAAPVAPARVLDEATTVIVSPRRFEIDSVLLWQAKAVTEREWNWPQLSPGDWLDTFLYHMMRAHGIILGAYQVVRRGDGEGSRPER